MRGFLFGQIIFFRLAPAPRRTIFNVFPIALPFLAPGKRALTMRTDFFRQIWFPMGHCGLPIAAATDRNQRQPRIEGMSQTLTCPPLARAALTDRRIISDLRSDHAGETGAVWIYKGILAVGRDTHVRDFAYDHLATEQRHLDAMNAALPRQERSMMTPLWRVAGWITGAVPALLGPAAVFATIEAVETFVDHHYQEQIDYLDGIGGHDDLLAMLREFQADEVHHRNDASERAVTEGPTHLGTLWAKLVSTGSKLAVRAARRI